MDPVPGADTIDVVLAAPAQPFSFVRENDLKKTVSGTFSDLKRFPTPLSFATQGLLGHFLYLEHSGTVCPAVQRSSPIKVFANPTILT
jgi:hypothetical protein